MLGWFATFALLGAIGTWMARRYALAHSLVDQPGERRSHAVPTPRGGGVAIVAVVLVAVAIGAARSVVAMDLALAFGIGMLAIAAVGLVDDHRPLSPWLRLAVHALAAVGVAIAWSLEGGSLAMAVVIFAGCVGLTNAWNFMDGINGIAATQAALVALVIVFTVGIQGWGMVALALAAACLGFLPFNFPNARIFLGDVGSGAIGFAIAALAVLALGDEPRTFWLLVPMLLSAFVLDAGLTLLRRVIRGERWWTPHTQHAYQSCARKWGHARVTISYCVWTAASALISLRAAVLAPQLMWIVIGAWYTAGALLWLMLQRATHGHMRMDPV
ncbi:lipopolysaccharide biosynthesis protein [Lysobacter korlensis]|uniref:Lipopolysaccharide biosynthesis protein n=1 Tax=Lysobacter korlensis TaxID=553636 RepID=A0ABV6RPE3_9GAMM